MTAYSRECVREKIPTEVRLKPTANEPMERVASTMLPIELLGHECALEAHAFQSRDGTEQLIVLINRTETAHPAAIPLVRIHSGCVTGDIFHSLRCDCHQQLQSALQMITDAPFGALVYIPYQEGRGIGLFKKIQAYAHQDQGLDTVDANLAVGSPVDARDYSLACEALRDLEITAIRLLSNNPDKLRELKLHGIDVVERIAMKPEPNPHNAHYLATKRQRLAHDW
ncbi:GTP cyclohydrolase II [Hyphomicrobium sp. ghe19]|uniref:GTP cyclohydrolase II n=1 Tax=Hyphomicrobium sp. ghe19 TaxID=2682968 RepID=UPI001367388E|nr:Riboflavin biosynthesis protein RibBA [Hyphomicrobium sp. ghe19]